MVVTPGHGSRIPQCPWSRACCGCCLLPEPGGSYPAPRVSLLMLPHPRIWIPSSPSIPEHPESGFGIRHCCGSELAWTSLFSFFLHFTPLLPRAGGLLGGGVFVQNEGKDLEFKGLEKELNKGPGELSGNLG